MQNCEVQLLDWDAMQALNQIEDLDELEEQLQAIQANIEEELAKIESSEIDQSNLTSDEVGNQQIEQSAEQRVLSEVLPQVDSNPQSALKKLREIVDQTNAKFAQLEQNLHQIDINPARRQQSLNKKSKQTELNETTGLVPKIQLIAQWLVKSALRRLTRNYRQNDDGVEGQDQIGYERIFEPLAKIFGAQTALKIFIDHRSTLLKIEINRKADDLESQNEKPLLKSKQNDDAASESSSQSVVVTLQDVEVEPSLLLEHAMVFFEAEIMKVDIPTLNSISSYKRNDSDRLIVQQRDYLKYVFEPILVRLLEQVHKKALGLGKVGRDRLLNFNNLQKLFTLLAKHIDVGALNLDTETDNASANNQSVTVAKMIKDLESTYLNGLIESFIQSESQRMFEFLETRTLKVFEQVNQRHIVQESAIKDVLEQEAKMATSTSPFNILHDQSGTEVEPQSPLQVVKKQEIVEGEEEVYLASECAPDKEELHLPADPSIKVLQDRRKSSNRRNRNYAQAEDEAVADNEAGGGFAPSPRVPLPARTAGNTITAQSMGSAQKPPRPNAFGQSLNKKKNVTASQGGIRFGKNNKVVPLVMQSVQNAPQSLRDSQQLAMGTLKVVPSEQRLGDKTRATAGNDKSGSLIRLGKQATEIDINFAAQSSLSDVAKNAVFLEKQLFAQRKTIQEERLRLRQSQQSAENMSEVGNRLSAARSSSLADLAAQQQPMMPKPRPINRMGSSGRPVRDIKSPEYHMQLLRANQIENNQQVQSGQAEKSKINTSSTATRLVKDIEFNFTPLLPQFSGEDENAFAVVGKINQGLRDFFKNVADPLCSQLLKGIHKTISLNVAESFLQSMKTITIQISNNLLVTIQRRAPKPEDDYYGLYGELSQANQASAFTLASLSDAQICTFFNELIFTRFKCEEHYTRLSDKLLTTFERHQLRKPVAEIQMKTLQVLALLREGFISHVATRLETTCLQSLVAQHWSYHKENFTSTSWIQADKLTEVVSPFENSRFLRYVVPKEAKKKLVLQPSHGLTAWRLQLISLRRDLFKWLAPYSQPNKIVVDAPRNTLASHIFNSILTQSCLSILAKLIAINPSRARSRQYTLDLAYFNWCVKNHIELATVELLTAQLAAKQEEAGIGAETSNVTKESLDLAIVILNLHLVHQTTSSALMLLSADTDAKDSSNQKQIKELLSASLSRKAQILNYTTMPASGEDFGVFSQLLQAISGPQMTNLRGSMHFTISSNRSQSSYNKLSQPGLTLAPHKSGINSNLISSIQVQAPKSGNQDEKGQTKGVLSEQQFLSSEHHVLQTFHKAILDSLKDFTQSALRKVQSIDSESSLAELSAEFFFAKFLQIIAPEQRNLFGSYAASSSNLQVTSGTRQMHQLHNLQYEQRHSSQKLRGSSMNPMVDEDLHQPTHTSNAKSLLFSNGVTPGGENPPEESKEEAPSVDFPDAEVVIGSAEVLLKSNNHHLKSQGKASVVDDQKTSVADIATPGGHDFDTVDVHKRNDQRPTLQEQDQFRTKESQSVEQRVKTPDLGSLPEPEGNRKSDSGLGLPFKQQLSEQYSQIMQGFVQLKPGQVIQEFKIAVEDCQSAPFTLEPFLRLKSSLRDFNYRLMPPKLILTFLAKRFDLSQDETQHPPLTEEQAQVRRQLEATIASFKENSGS